MRLSLKCEGCGAERRFIWNDKTIPDVEKAYKEGWRTVEGKVYCPMCMAAIGKEADYNSLDIFWKVLYEQMPRRKS